MAEEAPPEFDEPLLTFPEGARKLKVGARHIYDAEWRKQAGLNAIRIGRLWRLDPAEIRRFIASRRERPEGG